MARQHRLLEAVWSVAKLDMDLAFFESTAGGFGLDIANRCRAPLARLLRGFNW